jgi:type II secretory pathway predicted ATPase ExeA
MFLDFYGLRQQPFGVTPDPAYLYPSQTHSRALAALSAGINEGRGFFALVAEPGMGKTTLLYRLLEELRDSTRTVYLFQTQCDKREFFQYLLAELGVDTRGMDLVTLHSKLNEVLFAELLAGKRFVLVVDEAQNLEDPVLETIRLLSNFETTHTKLLQIVLAGQPELATKLTQPRLLQLRQRIAVLEHLQPLSVEETTAYIEHRLQVAGWSGDPLFAPDALAAVARATRGIPRNINSLSYNALSLGCERAVKPVTAEIVREAAEKLGMESFADVVSHPIAAGSAKEVEAGPELTAGGESQTTSEATAIQSPAEIPVPVGEESDQAPAGALVGASVVAAAAAPDRAAVGTSLGASLTYEAFTYQAAQRRRWAYPAVAVGILALLAISIPALLRIAGPGLARAASISKLNRAAPPPATQDSGYAPEFGPAYSASPSDTDSGQVLTVVAMPQQTLRDVVLQHGGQFDQEMVTKIRALNPQLNLDQIDAGQLIRIPLPFGTWQKSFDSADTGDANAPKSQPVGPKPQPKP